MPRQVAEDHTVKDAYEVQRCYLIVACDAIDEARKIPLFVRTVGAVVMEDVARPITKENFFDAKDAIDFRPFLVSKISRVQLNGN